ncbi:18733_t:CDS:2 [Rhizophagus irregularis]|nr:18733_t:CDS:2 [Rhizophagus irregularis]
MWLSVEKRISDSILQLNGQIDRLAQQKISGSWPTRITRWKGFLAEVDRYNFDEIERLERPHFLVITSTLVWKSNIFGVLNKVMKNYKFAKQKDSNFSLDSDIGPFTPVYTCRLRIDNTFSKQILAIEIKRSYYRIFQALQQSQQNSGSGHISQIFRSLSNPHYNLRSTSGDQGLNENQDPTEEEIFEWIVTMLSKKHTTADTTLPTTTQQNFTNITPLTLLAQQVDTDTVCIKEGKKRIIGEQGDRSKVEDAENEGGE